MSTSYNHPSNQNQEPNPDKIPFSELYALAQEATQGEGSKVFTDEVDYNRYEYVGRPIPDELVAELFCAKDGSYLSLDPESVSGVSTVESYIVGQEEPVSHRVDVVIYTTLNREGIAPLDVNTTYMIEQTMATGEERSWVMVEYSVGGKRVSRNNIKPIEEGEPLTEEAARGTILDIEDSFTDMLPEERETVAKLLKVMAEEKDNRE